MERRLAAILAADVVGYSRLMGQDEAGTLQALKALRAEVIDPKVAEHKGRIFKATGDGVLAEFPSVVNAVSCAVEIQRGMDGRPLQLRIGVHLGDVVVEDGDVFGDGVNLAARVEGVASPGGVALSASAFEHVGNRLGLQFEDRGEHSLKNIDRPVKIYQLNFDGAAAIAPTSPRRTAAAVEKPSIAVLPFNNMSGDAEQEYFADGITEDIITELSRNRGLFVIARSSTFTFKGRAVNIAEAGRLLGVRYLVEGSVRKAGSKVRITAQLIEAATGSHIWADRYDRQLEDIFAVQDEVTRSVVAAVPGHLASDVVKASRRKPTESLTAYDHYLRGVDLVNRWRNDDISQAMSEFKRAVEIDPTFARAHASLGHSHLRLYWQSLDQSALVPAGEETELAVRLDAEDSRCLSTRGMYLLAISDFDGGHAAIQRALHFSPNDPEVLERLTYYLACVGQPEQAIELAQETIKANPIFLPTSLQETVGTAYMAARRYEDAVKSFSALDSPGYYIRARMAGCLVKLGRVEEARLHARAASALKADWVKDNWGFEFKNAADRAHEKELARLAQETLAEC